MSDDSRPLVSVFADVAALLAIPAEEFADESTTLEIYDDQAGSLVQSSMPDWEVLLQLLEDAGIPSDAFEQAEAELSTVAGALVSVHGALELVLDPNQDPDAGDVVQAVVEAVDAVRELEDVEVTATAPPADEIAVALLEHLVVRHLHEERPRLFYLLGLLGVVDEAAYREGRRGQLRIDRLDDALADPSGAVADTLGWGTPDFDNDRVVELFVSLARSYGARSARVVDAPEHELAGNDSDAVDAAALHAATVTLARGEDGTISAGLAPLIDAAGQRGLVFYVSGEATGEDAVAVGDDWELVLDGEAASAAQFGIVLHPVDGITAAAADGGSPPDGALRVLLRRTATDRVELLDAGPLQISVAGGSGEGRLALTGGEVGGAITLRAEDGRIALAPSGDGFVRALLPEGAEAGFSPEVGWDSRTGFHLGGDGLSARIPLALELAALLRLELLDLALRPAAAGLELDLRLTGAATLGPVVAVLEGLGVGLVLGWDGGADAPLEASVRFLPPRGVGVSVDAGPISGGGFVAHDPDRGRYVGALSLTVDELGLGAFGILDTRLPGREDGWSLLLFIYASFPAIQLGFGFTLVGVGGIVGIHRGIDVDALFSAVRAGTARRLLAPENPVRDAPVLAQEAGTIFPVQHGQHTLGPSLRLGWGTPTLVQLDVALAVSLPDPLRVVLIGSLHAALPHEDAAVLLLNVDVAGVLDLGASRLDAEGRLYDSHVQLIPVEGGFALRSSWGRSPSLAFSIGGLHPRYVPPPGFPELERFGTDLSRGSLRVRLWGYFAITSNSLQLGAGADLRFSAKGFVVEGGLAFDALVVFDPFQLDVSIRAWVSVSHKGDHLLELRLEGRLSGPNRWRVKGSVHVQVLLFDVSIGVEASFGTRREVGLDPVRILGPLEEALAAPASWEAAGPSTAALVLDEMAGRIAPDAAPAVSQRTAPLEVRVDRFRAAEVVGPRRFRITAAEVNGHDRALGDERTEEFAPGDFREMTDAERLAAPSFEPLPSGVALGGAAIIEEGGVVTAETGPEVIVIDAPDDAPRRPRSVTWQHVLTTLRRDVPAATAAPLLTVEPERWTTTAAPGAGTSWARAAEGDGIPALEVELT